MIKGYSCAFCTYWQLVVERSGEGFQDEGICRYNPPIAIPSIELSEKGDDPSGDRGVLTAWPRTFSESDWCSKYRSRNEYVLGRESLETETP